MERSYLNRLHDAAYYKIVVPFENFVMAVFPVKNNKVVFDNFCGKGYGCNPKYIANALLNTTESPNIDIVWVVNDMSVEMPKGIRKVQYGTLKAAYEWATAKVWVDNVRDSRKVHKKKNQFYIQTWHGSIGLKKSEQEVEDSLPVNYVKAAKHDGKITNLMISNGKYRTDRYHNHFWYSGDVLECGFPRNDILINPTKEVRDKVYKTLGIAQNKKVILYAPTFRLNTVDPKDPVAPFKFDYENCRKKLGKKFGEEYVFLLRMHPNIAKYSNLFSFSDDIKNATGYPDMQELLAVSDVLITDYSACMFDSMIAKHKVFLLAKDIDEYTSRERGLLFNFRELPCTLAESQEELEDNIQTFDMNDYLERCNSFFKKIGFKELGTASETVANLIIGKLNS